jgi:addiction module HigA family antidote
MPPVHPGEILREELAEIGLSANAFARSLGVPTNRITAILNGTRGINADSALSRLARYFGTSENAVKTQIWIAASIYVLVAIIEKRLDLKLSLYTMLQILRVTILEKTPLFPMLNNSENTLHPQPNANQLNLFSY